jgi:hypothetical protein
VPPVRIITTHPDRIDVDALPFGRADVLGVNDFREAPHGLTTGVFEDVKWPPIWIGVAPDPSVLIADLHERAPGDPFVLGVTTPDLLSDEGICQAVDAAQARGMPVGIAVRFDI